MPCLENFFDRFQRKHYSNLLLPLIGIGPVLTAIFLKKKYRIGRYAVTTGNLLLAAIFNIPFALNLIYFIKRFCVKSPKNMILKADRTLWD